MAMAAGVRYQRLVLALGAGGEHLGAGLSTAMLHRCEGVKVLGAQAVAVLVEEGRLEVLDDRGEADHLTAPQARVKPSMSALIRSIAWYWVRSVRWV